MEPGKDISGRHSLSNRHLLQSPFSSDVVGTKLHSRIVNGKSSVKHIMHEHKKTFLAYLCNTLTLSKILPGVLFWPMVSRLG